MILVQMWLEPRSIVIYSLTTPTLLEMTLRIFVMAFGLLTIVFVQLISLNKMFPLWKTYIVHNTVYSPHNNRMSVTLQNKDSSSNKTPNRYHYYSGSNPKSSLWYLPEFVKDDIYLMCARQAPFIRLYVVAVRLLKNARNTVVANFNRLKRCT